MPFIDVSDLLYDSYIAGEKFTVYRRTEVVNQYGENLIAVIIFDNIAGQISPHIPSRLLREPSFTSREKYIQVITPWFITGGGVDALNNLYQPDLVLWKNNLYIVKAAQDYSKYGTGFIVAQCEIFDWIVDIATIPSGTTKFITTLDGQFVITPDEQIVTTVN
jgi:hypothetical protein